MTNLPPLMNGSQMKLSDFKAYYERYEETGGSPIKFKNFSAQLNSKLSGQAITDFYKPDLGHYGAAQYLSEVIKRPEFQNIVDNRGIDEAFEWLEMEIEGDCCNTLDDGIIQVSEYQETQGQGFYEESAKETHISILEREAPSRSSLSSYEYNMPEYGQYGSSGLYVEQFIQASGDEEFQDVYNRLRTCKLQESTRTQLEDRYMKLYESNLERLKTDGCFSEDLYQLSYQQHLDRGRRN